MTTYIVTRKSDSAPVFRYSGDSAVEWRGFEFATHDHLVVPDPIPPAPPPRPAPVFLPIEFLRRFTPVERMSIRSFSRVDQVAEDFMALLEMTDAIHTNDVDVIRGLMYLTHKGHLAPGRAAEILGGA